MQSALNPAIAHAMASVEAAIPKAVADPLRPRYHFTPPANWMNDPNGTIYHNGVYHLFYQHNPYGDAWEHMHWGHATSEDLTYWTHQPIALWPSLEQGEAHCFSGCSAVNADDVPLLFYTSVGPGESQKRPPNQQWIAVGDSEWRTWQKDDANPFLALNSHDGPPFEDDWRDPYIFTSAGRNFLVIGGNIGGDPATAEATVALYEAQTPDLREWTFRSIIYRRPATEMRFCECPNFFPLDDGWILLLSPYRPVEYTVGDFDLATYTFTPTTTGILDPGFTPGITSAHFYATNTLIDADQRRVLLGWIRGFPPDKGWNGCLALPRLLTLGDDRRPRQLPHPALKALREGHQRISAQQVQPGSTMLATAPDSCLELLLHLEPQQDAKIAIDICPQGSSTPSLRLGFADERLHVDDETINWPRSPDGSLSLRLFLDRSVIELFSHDGQHAITLVKPLPLGPVEISLAVQQGTVDVLDSNLWQMASI